MKRKFSKPLRVFFVVLLFAIAGFAGWFTHYAHSPLSADRYPLEFGVSEGGSLRGVAHDLAAADIIEHPWAFILLGRISGDATRLKAGEYEIGHAVSPLELLRKITSGEVVQRAITLVEGWTFRQLRDALNAQEMLRHDTVQLSDQEILRLIDAQETHPEGLFFPDTYRFSKGSSDVAVLKRAYSQMKALLSEKWAQRRADLPFKDSYEALILASIVEKETGVNSERSMVAAVFVNRLKLNMLLQTDPSVIYGLGQQFDGNLRKRDLMTDGPYNTYTRAGLPPSPIAMPGLAALDATFNPARSAAIYFVSRGDGSSEFSETLTDHNRAVARYQKGSRVHP
jgi:UPF0755 protein